jgi:hypothetical protein
MGYSPGQALTFGRDRRIQLASLHATWLLVNRMQAFLRIHAGG